MATAANSNYESSDDDYDDPPSLSDLLEWVNQGAEVAQIRNELQASVASWKSELAQTLSTCDRQLAGALHGRKHAAASLMSHWRFELSGPSWFPKRPVGHALYIWMRSALRRRAASALPLKSPHHPKQRRKKKPNGLATFGFQPEPQESAELKASNRQVQLLQEEVELLCDSNDELATENEELKVQVAALQEHLAQAQETSSMEHKLILLHAQRQKHLSAGEILEATKLRAEIRKMRDDQEEMNRTGKETLKSLHGQLHEIQSQILVASKSHRKPLVKQQGELEMEIAELSATIRDVSNCDFQQYMDVSPKSRENSPARRRSGTPKCAVKHPQRPGSSPLKR